MFDRLAPLPDSLKVVVWINIGTGLLTLSCSVASLAIGQAMQACLFVATTLINLLTIVGILQASRFIRMLMLVLLWMGTGMNGLQLLIGIFSMQLKHLMLVLPLTLNALVLWGLLTKEAKAYFQPKPATQPTTPLQGEEVACGHSKCETQGP